MKNEKWLREYFESKAGRVDFENNENIFELGLIDSFDLILLIEDLENEFNMKFTQDDLMDSRFLTISGIADIISEKN